MDDLLVLPEHLEEFEGHYSNFDHEMPQGANEALRSGEFYIEHSAYGHWGTIWFQNGKFHEMVNRYTVHVATISADSIEEVIEDVNDRFGYD